MTKQTLTSAQVSQMQKLQQLFHNRYLTPQFLHQLVSVYVKCIQCFEDQFLFMRAYFIEKMQFVLGAPEILIMLEGGGTAVDSIRETVRGTERVFPPEQKLQPKHSKPQKQPISTTSTSSSKPTTTSATSTKPTTPSSKPHLQCTGPQKLELQMKAMREFEEQKKHIHRQVNEAQGRILKNQERVKDITRNQEESFNDRLAKRKNKNLRKKSVEIKARVLVQDGEEQEPQSQQKKQEIKEELKSCQRELTNAVNKFTVRMTQKQQEQQHQHKNNIKGRIKAARRDLEEEDNSLAEKPQIEEAEDEDEISHRAHMIKKKQSGLGNGQPVMGTQHKEKEEEKEEEKEKGGKQEKMVADAPKGRIKTTRRNLDDDDE